MVSVVGVCNVQSIVGVYSVLLLLNWQNLIVVSGFIIVLCDGKLVVMLFVMVMQYIDSNIVIVSGIYCINYMLVCNNVLVLMFVQIVYVVLMLLVMLFINGLVMYYSFDLLLLIDCKVSLMIGFWVVGIDGGFVVVDFFGGMVFLVDLCIDVYKFMQNGVDIVLSL